MDRNFDNIQESYHKDPEKEMDYDDISWEISCIAYDMADVALILKELKNKKKIKKFEAILKFLEDRYAKLLKVYTYLEDRKTQAYYDDYYENHTINAYYHECVEACYDY